MQFTDPGTEACGAWEQQHTCRRTAVGDHLQQAIGYSSSLLLMIFEMSPYSMASSAFIQ